MKIAVNDCFGGWGLSKEFLEKYPQFKKCYERNDPEFIAALEEFGTDKASGEYSHIRITEISDEATDFMINEYDGMENVIYVLEGKIYFS